MAARDTTAARRRRPPAPSDAEALRARVARVLPGRRADLEAMVRIPSVSAPAFNQAEVERAPPSSPACSGTPACRRSTSCGSRAARRQWSPRRPAPAGAPTVMLYAHHDVQPPGGPVLWDAPAFEPVERNGRLYGRGSADDKAGVALHLAALRALADDLAVGVTVFVEGEEEIRLPDLRAVPAEHRDQLAADVIVVADSGNWRIGEPALTTSLRGLVDGVVTVRTLDHAVHSGMYGGAVPDAVTALLSSSRACGTTTARWPSPAWSRGRPTTSATRGPAARRCGRARRRRADRQAARPRLWARPA